MQLNSSNRKYEENKNDPTKSIGFAVDKECIERSKRGVLAYLYR